MQYNEFKEMLMNILSEYPDYEVECEEAAHETSGTGILARPKKEELWVTLRKSDYVSVTVFYPEKMFLECGQEEKEEIRKKLLSALPGAIKRKPKPLRTADCMESLSEDDRELFMKLCELRRIFSERENVRPYVVFSNRVLLEMCLQKPDTMEKLMTISGVGRVNSAKYGQAFLGAIGAFFYKEDGE